VLSTRRKILGYYTVALGSLDSVVIHAREVFRPAIVGNAAAMVLLHNHPSGDPSPSEADIKVTRDLLRAGQLLKIELLDHLIMGEALPARPKEYVSLRELGYWAGFSLMPS
jgi:DNA repair protein RadC